MRSGIVALCDALQAVGIDCVFGVPGTQNVHLFEGFRQRRIRTVLASSELAASFMANGYYRATGRVAALATIPGPGFTYALTGIAEARLDSVGLIYLVGKPASAPGRRFHLQAIDQRAIASPLLKGCFTLDASTDADRIVREAHALSIGGEPGPVMIELDMEAMTREQPPTGTGAVMHATAPRQLDAARLTRLEVMFARAERPVLLLGQGAFGAATPLATLADSLTIPVVTTPTARGILSEAHSMAMGFDPLRGHTDTVNALFQRSDLILGLGCKLGHNGSDGFALRLPADRFVHVDAEPGVAGATYDAILTITARVEDVLPVLDSRRAVSGWRREELEDVGRALRAPTGQEVEPLIRGANTMTPAAFFAWLREQLPPDAIVVTDSGLHQILTRRHFEVRSARGLIVPSDFQSMGFGLPAAIGATLAATDRPVVALVGDGGFLMSGMELLTARREGARLVVVVFNDGQLNQIRLQQFAAFGRAHAVQLLNPDYRTLAAAFDVDFLRFGEHEAGALTRALGVSKPTLVEVIVGDSLAMRALPPVVRAKALARATLGSTLRRWLKARMRRTSPEAE